MFGELSVGLGRIEDQIEYKKAEADDVLWRMSKWPLTKYLKQKLDLASYELWKFNHQPIKRDVQRADIVAIGGLVVAGALFAGAFGAGISRGDIALVTYGDVPRNPCIQAAPNRILSFFVNHETEVAQVFASGRRNVEMRITKDNQDHALELIGRYSQDYPGSNISFVIVSDEIDLPPRATDMSTARGCSTRVAVRG